MGYQSWKKTQQGLTEDADFHRVSSTVRKQDDFPKEAITSKMSKRKDQSLGKHSMSGNGRIQVRG
jgi:hypothetical protein